MKTLSQLLSGLLFFF